MSMAKGEDLGELLEALKTASDERRQAEKDRKLDDLMEVVATQAFRAYVVMYGGMWLGGKAVVLARNEEEAVDLVREHGDTVNFQDWAVREVPFGGVLYNDNGNY